MSLMVLDGLDLSDRSGSSGNFAVREGFDLLSPNPKYDFAERRIGAALVPGATSPNAVLKIPLRCYGSSEDDLLDKIGLVVQKQKKAEAQASYSPIQLVITPVGATYASTLDVLTVEVGEVKYDHKHIRARAADFTLTLTCAPYVFGPWSTVASGRKGAGVPAKEIQISSLSGDVPGPARITLTNQGSTAQQFALLGLDGRGYASGNKLVLLPSTFDYSTAPLNGTYTAGTNEVQTATKSGTISGGTFTLTYEGQTTSALAYNATTGTVQTALEALSTIGSGNITVGGTSLNAGNMTFTGAGDLAGTDLSLIVLNSSLTGGGSAPITQTTQGVSGYVANTSLQSSFSDFIRTGDQTDTGSFQLWALVYTDADQNNARIRASISIGDTGSAVINRSATIPAKDAQVWVNLGPVHAKQRQSSGSYRWNATIGAMTVGTAGTDVRVLRIVKVPVDLGVGVVKTPQTTTQTLVASDDFNQSAGALTGKTADLGGTWSGGGDADDFTIDTTDHRITRTAVNDTAGTGRRVYCGNDVVGCLALVTMWATGTPQAGSRCGVLLRRVDSTTYAVAVRHYTSATEFEYRLYKVISGTATLLASSSTFPHSTAGAILAAAYSSGDVYLSWGAGATDVISAQDSTFATGGALESGKVGIYDEHTSASASVREYENFRAYAVPATDAAAFASRRLAWQPDGTVEREASTGTYFGYAAGQQRTGVPLLDPSGTNRLLVASADFNPDSAGSTAQNVPLDYQVEHRPAFAIGRH